MSAFEEAKTVLSSVETALSASGSGLTLSNVGKAIQDGINSLQALTLADAEKAALVAGLDIAEDFIPQLKLAVDAVKFIESLPGYKPADFDSPVRRATDDGPYSGNIMGQTG